MSFGRAGVQHPALDLLSIRPLFGGQRSLPSSQANHRTLTIRIRSNGPQTVVGVQHHVDDGRIVR